MEITLSTKKYDHSVPEVIRVPVHRKILMQTAWADRVVIAGSGSKNWDFSTNVPEGYTFVSYMDAAIGGTDSFLKQFYYDDGAKVYCANKTSSAVYAKGQDETDPDHYYYTIDATLICVRSDLLPQEETP
ncbi:MAG: hypothetical protein IKE08_01795 [Clostridia bacterium]|nr:hypothetical protein [Clostridia bacterium]